VPYAVTLRLADAASVEAMWRALAMAGLHDDCLRLGYPPHVTLAILPDTCEEARLAAVVGDCAARWTRHEVRIAGFGWFVAPSPVLYLAAIATEDLLRLQRAVAEALGDLPRDSHYCPGAWVPHVTLAKGAPAGTPGWAGRALDLLAPLLPPDWRTVAERLDLVRFRPVAVLRSHALPDGLAPEAASVYSTIR
jgi:2'-5' RNA ligase